MKDSKKYYFTYGTLMHGKGRSFIMETMATLVGQFPVTGYKLYDFYNGSDNYPVAIYTGNSEDVIMGEVWCSDYDITELLDRIEGYPTLYTREYVSFPSLDYVNATMYVGNIESWKIIEDKSLMIGNEPVIKECPSGSVWDYRE